MALFSRPLGGDLRSSAYPAPAGYPGEHHPVPAAVDLGDGNVPGMHGVNGGPARWDGDTGNLYQDTAASYAGVYIPDYRHDVGAQPAATELAPAPGSENLIRARDANGIPGTNRAISVAGPVTGTSDNLWSSRRAATVAKPVTSMRGPVTGGQDTGTAATRAYYSQQASYISQAQAEASLMAVV